VLHALGRELVEYLPFVPLAQGVRIGVAILSYNGGVRFVVTTDNDTVPEVGVVLPAKGGRGRRAGRAGREHTVSGARE
jgi:hypothetical protein